MNIVPTCCLADVSLLFDSEKVLRFVCSVKYSDRYKKYFSDAGFLCGATSINTRGTSNIYDIVEFQLDNTEFDDVKQSLQDLYKSINVTFEEEQTEDQDSNEIHLTITLTNVIEEYFDSLLKKLASLSNQYKNRNVQNA